MKMSFKFAVLSGVAFGVCTAVHAAEQVKPLLFDTADHGEPGDKAPVIEPWCTVELEPDYSGDWVVAGDVDGDGEIEIVSAENFNENDVHYTSAVSAQNLDGTVLWTWGDPDEGRKDLHHDVACQIHDWDNDGKNEVVVCTKGSIVELDGATGAEKRRIPIPAQATDSLVFCDLAGAGHPSDVLVKDRYRTIHAYDRKGTPLWSVKDPGGCRTAHQPRPIDIDGDGRDEIMAGYAMLNPDGSVRWVFESKAYDKVGGHLDCARVLRTGKRPEDFRIVITCCGGNDIALLNGHGKPLWEVTGHHFESIQVGRIIPDHPGLQILVDIDHQPRGEAPLWVLDENGTLLGQIMTDYARQHQLLDWDGDGLDEILVANNRGVFNHEGKRIATFGLPDAGIMAVGDMTGDGVPDVLMTSGLTVAIFKNDTGKMPDKPAPLGSGLNYTLY